ncbi:HD domain-containing protein [Cetobacterium sp.]|uniref:HD domain-containing protein n=1 Tax=Cetobacterium sp. TaxID=2071632 RepID=UPI003EE43694
MKLLEDMLKEKCEKEDTEILLAQWKYDKELYKDILQNTKDYYCHYTDHGIHHSEAVLSNIVRILGIDKIKELSSLDIWLLLEAAYIHDSGMFITRKEVEELCSLKDFLNYFDCLKLNLSSDLYEYTSYFEISNNKLVMLKNEYNLKAEYGLKFIIAEYNRSKHPKRAKGIVNNFNKFKKENTLIPKRITDIAFLIAEAHGKTFEEVMKIHKVETGLKLEKGHPRFIACMLRLGDLLDIDNNRFSKTILKNIEDIMPQKSKNHLEKHKSIAHYRVDSDSIEITAKIENYEDQTYDIVSEVSDWFEFLKKEHNLQVLNWGEIKPANFLGLLPRLGNIKIDVKDYEFIDNMNKPKFTVDTNNVLTILKGSGIYRNEFKALREIVQNSVDAIFLKVYKLNHEKISQDIEAKKDYNELKKKYLENEEIQIEVSVKNEEKIEIIIKDTGIGISKEDLKYLISAC